MNEQLEHQNNVEQLIPRTGVEHEFIGESSGLGMFSYVPLDAEPLFEQDGVKALAQIKIEHKVDGPKDTYYVVDVSAKGYTREEHGKEEKIDYLVVTSDFFSSPEAQQDRTTFASLRTPGRGQYDGPSTQVGGHNHNTRFDHADASGSFRVNISGSDQRTIVIGQAEYGGRDLEVAHKRDDNDPADFIKTHREQKAPGEVLATTEHDQKGKTVRSRFVNAVKRNFTKSKYDDFDHSDGMKFDPSRGYHKDVYDDMNRHDLEVLEDKVGLKPENAEQVGNALKAVEDKEREEVVAVVTEVLQKKRLHKGLGWAAAMATQGAAAYFDHKTGGVITEGRDSSASDLTAMAELATIGTGAYLSATLGMSAEKIHRLIRKGVNKILPANEAKEFKADSSEADFIRDVAEHHEKFLYELDKSVHNLRKDYEL